MTTETAGCDAVLFDVDGTLLDTVPLIVETYHAIFQQYLGHSGDDKAILASIGLPLDTFLHEVSPQHAAAMKTSYLDYNHTRLDTHVAVFRGILPMLADLQARGIPLGVVTSKRHDSATRSLAQFGLLPFFQTVITKDSTSRHKPFADPLFAAMKELGLHDSSRVVYVGDSLHDHYSARAAGCRSVLVSWTEMPVEDLLAAGPDLWLERPDLLAGWIDQGCLSQKRRMPEQENAKPEQKHGKPEDV